LLDGELYIRISENGQDFVYSIIRRGVCVASAVVPPAGEPYDVLLAVADGCEYHGGSEAMD
jgi:hypothetical protein